MSPPVVVVVVVSVVATVAVVYAVKETWGPHIKPGLKRASVKAKVWWNARKRSPRTAPASAVAVTPTIDRRPSTDTSCASFSDKDETGASSSIVERLVDSVVDDWHSNRVRIRKNKGVGDSSSTGGMEMTELDKPNAFIPQVPLTPSTTGTAPRSSLPFTLPTPFADTGSEALKSPDPGIHTGPASVSTVHSPISNPWSFPLRSKESALMPTPSEVRPPTPSQTSSPYVNVFTLSPNMDLSLPNQINQSGASLNTSNGGLGVFQRSPNTLSEASVSVSSWADGEAAPSESGESHMAFSIGSWSVATGDGHAHLNENASDSSSPSHHSISDLEHRPSAGGPNVMSDWESVGSPSASEDER